MFYSFGVLLKQQRKGENAQEKMGMEQERGCTDISKRWRRPRCLINQAVRNKRKIIRGKPLKCFWGAYCYPSCRKTQWEDQLSPTIKKPRAHCQQLPFLNAVHTLKSEWPWDKSQIEDHSLIAKPQNLNMSFLCITFCRKPTSAENLNRNK